MWHCFDQIFNVITPVPSIFFQSCFLSRHFCLFYLFFRVLSIFVFFTIFTRGIYRKCCFIIFEFFRYIIYKLYRRMLLDIFYININVCTIVKLGWIELFLQKKMLPSVGIEPTTTRLKVLRSTNWATTALYISDDWFRSSDLVVMSHTRFRCATPLYIRTPQFSITGLNRWPWVY